MLFLKCYENIAYKQSKGRIDPEYEGIGVDLFRGNITSPPVLIVRTGDTPI